MNDLAASAPPTDRRRPSAPDRRVQARRKADARRLVTEAQLREVQRLARLGNWNLDLRTNTLTWSDEIYRIFEIDPARFGASYEAFLGAIHPDDRAAVNQAYTDSVANRTPYGIDHRLRMADGRIKFVHEECETFYGADGVPLRSVGTVQDVTERKQAEESLARVNRSLRMIYAINEQVLRAENADALMQKVCELAVEAGGYHMSWIGRAEEAPGKPVRPVAFAGATGNYVASTDISWADEPRGRGPTGRAIREGTPQLARFILTDPAMAPWRERAIRHGYASSCALPLRVGKKTFGALMVYSERPDAFDTDEIRVLAEMAGDLGFGLASLGNRAESRAARAALQVSEERFRTLAVATTQVVWTTNARGEVAGDMPSWRAFTGQPVEAMQGQGWGQCLHPDDRERTARVWADSVATRLPYATEYRLRRHDGQYRWVAARGVPVLETDGSIREWVGTCTDIEERRRSEQEIRKLNATLEHRVAQRTAQLETANHDLEAFAYSVSHDLRAPLRAIDSFSMLLLEERAGQLDAEGRRLLGTVRRNSQKMGQLIDDILAFSRAGRGESRLQDVDAGQMVRDLLAELQPAAAARPVDIRVGNLPRAWADPAVLRQVFFNLIANALKFTAPKPSALIEISGTATAAETTYSVRDNGVGFDPAYAHKLFGVFQRLHGVEEFPGTGIGLAIVKRIVERHGGRVGAEGRVNEGATFWFTLPAGRAGSIEPGADERPTTEEAVT